jgi:hypothetical protein
MDDRKQAVEHYREMGLFEHTVAWNGKYGEDPHVRVIDLGYGLAKVFHPRNVEVGICNFCAYSDMGGGCPQRNKARGVKNS